MLTKRYYDLLASIIANHVAAERLAGNKLGREENLVSKLAAVMQKDNPRFDKQRFWKECGL